MHGVGLFIDENVKYRVVERVTNSSYQALWIEFQQSNDKKNMCGIVYRQHNDANDSLIIFLNPSSALTGIIIIYTSWETSI